MRLSACRTMKDGIGCREILSLMTVAWLALATWAALLVAAWARTLRLFPPARSDLDPLVDGRAAAVLQRGSVDLPDGSRGVGFLIEIGEQLSDPAILGGFDVRAEPHCRPLVTLCDDPLQPGKVTRLVLGERCSLG